MGLTYHTPQLKLKDLQGKEIERLQRPEVIDNLEETFFWTQQGNCTYKPTEIVTSYTRPTLDHATQNAIVGRVRVDMKSHH